MYKEDYKIIVEFDKDGDPYWQVLRKGEPHNCNMEELKMVSKAFNLLRMRIDFITSDVV